MTVEEAIKILEYPVYKWSLDWDDRDDGLSYSDAIQMAIDALKSQHSVEDNPPLTLEELREMDGEPVWVERPGYDKRWALVQVWAKSTNVIYFTYNNGLTSIVQVELDCGGLAYRRKPEEGAP